MKRIAPLPHLAIVISMTVSLPVFFTTRVRSQSAIRDNTQRVSVDSTGKQGNNGSFNPSISSDGRFVAFASYASNLVAADTNGSSDIFFHDRTTGSTTRVSVDSAGKQANDRSFYPSISSDGRFVAFSSYASNLVAGDTNGSSDIFVHDRTTGKTTRVSVDSSGTEGDNPSGIPSISSDGRFVAFQSNASNLVGGDTNRRTDVFVHDRTTGKTTRVSVDSIGTEGDNHSGNPSISPDGRFVAFHSEATNLVTGDTNNCWDIFVHDRTTGSTTRVSVDSSGKQGNSWSQFPSISLDGRFVAFQSDATNLVTGDTNNCWDIFVHDRTTGKTTRASVDSNGKQGSHASGWASISPDGRFVALWSISPNLVRGDTNGTTDIFVHDRSTGRTTRVSVDSTGKESNDQSGSGGVTISGDGQTVAFESGATNLVGGDTNGQRDVFVHGRALLLGSGTPKPGGTVSFSLGDGNDVGLPYQLGSSLGIGPIPIGERELGLTPDDLLVVSVTLQWPMFFSGYRGVIDKNGQAKAAVNIPNISVLTGLKIHTAFVTLQGSSPFGMKSISDTYSFTITR